MTPENPPSAIVRIEIEQAAFHNGWRIDEGVHGGWFHRASSSAPGHVTIAGAGPEGPWLLAIDHLGVAAELGLPSADIPGPGVARFVLPDPDALHGALSRVWELAVSLPDHPLRRFQDETAALPRETEAERLVVQRRGQDIFRESLMAYWNRRCPLTGISDPELLRASHLKPWAACKTDTERLDPYNGVLLSALWDAAFDSGLATFDEGGRAILSSSLSPQSAGLLPRSTTLELGERHLPYLAWHRENVFRE